MYDKLISKNISHFGKEGVLMYSKSCDYYNTNQILLSDIQMFYELLKSNEYLPQFNNISRWPYISCCLYYLSKNDNKYVTIFTKDIIQKLSRKDEVNDNNLYLIFNIIEFDQRYLQSKSEKLQFLLEYLEKFSPLKKTIENFLLYKYYRGLLKFNLGQINDAYSEYLEIIIGSEDFVNQKTQYIDFIRLKNNLLKVRLDLSKHIREEYFEQYCFMKELFDKVKKENKTIGIRLGFCLYTILWRQNKYNECIPLLMEMKQILKKESLSGVNLKSSIDFYLAIESRIGYIGSLIGNKESVKCSIKKLSKILDIIEKDKEDKKLSLIYNAYTFIISIFNIYLGIYEKNLKQKAAIFASQFFNNKLDIKNNLYLVNNENKNDLIINLNAVNNMDYNLNSAAIKIMDTYKDIINANKKLESNQFLVFIVGMHDIISRLSESYCTDYNINKRKDYIKSINNHTQIVYNYVKIIYDQEPLIETDFVKSLLININSACVHANIFCKNMDMAKKIITFFDDLSKLLNIKESNTSFELINKIKGDFWFKIGYYDSAINYYIKAVNQMGTNDPKRPIVYFNLGCSFYLKKDKKKSIEYLNQCINAFRELECGKKTFDVLVRKNVIAKKVDLAKHLLKNMEFIK